jgi:hypothetical protein
MWTIFWSHSLKNDPGKELCMYVQQDDTPAHTINNLGSVFNQQMNSRGQGLSYSLHMNVSGIVKPG